MNYNETRIYIERQLVKLGWKVQLGKASYKKIFQYTGGEEDRVGHLYYKLVSVGSLHPGRVIIDNTVDAAIDDLKRMEDIVDKAKAEGKSGRKSQAELDRISIEQLAKTLETEVALEAKEVRVKEEKFPKVEPVEKAESVETVQSKAAHASSLPRILVVDDSPTIRAAVTKALKNDFSFVQASDGEEAWKLLKNDDSIQLVITDLMMPNLDGFELIKRIRSDRTSPRVAEIPIIVVTTLEATNAKLRALVAGANDFVTKSTDAVELKMRVMARYEVAQSEKMLAHGRTQAAPQREPRREPQRAPQAPMTAAQVMHAAAQVAHAAPPPRAGQASTNATPRNGSSAGAMAGSGSSAAMPRFPDPGTARSEARRPISPAAISAPVSSVVQTIGYGKLGEAIESGKALLDRLAKVNPLTAITLGATGLIVLIVVGIAVINRPQRSTPPLTAGTLQMDTITSAQGVADKPLDTASLPAPKTTEPAKALGNTHSATGSVAKSAPATKANQQTPEPKREQQPTDVAATSRTPGQAGTSTIQTTGQTPAATSTSGLVVGAVMPSSSSSVEPVTSGKGGSAAAGEPGEGKSAVTASAAAPAPAVSKQISQSDLTGVVKRFEFVYEAGDIEQFLRLFDDDVRTNDRYSKDGLREDYEELFKTTDMRKMVLGNVTWEARDNHADGWGNFEVSVRKAGEQEIKTYKGSLTFYVEKIDGRVRIKRLYHGQWRAG